MKGIQFLIFDLEGVIIDTEPIWAEADAEFLKRRGISYNSEEVKPIVMGCNLVDGAQMLQQKYDFGGDPEELGRERREIVKELFKQNIGFMPGFLDFLNQPPANTHAPLPRHLSVISWQPSMLSCI